MVHDGARKYATERFLLYVPMILRSSVYSKSI